jgi:hypothetical protein
LDSLEDRFYHVNSVIRNTNSDAASSVIKDNTNLGAVKDTFRVVHSVGKDNSGFIFKHRNIIHSHILEAASFVSKDKPFLSISVPKDVSIMQSVYDVTYGGSTELISHRPVTPFSPFTPTTFGNWIERLVTFRVIFSFYSKHVVLSRNRLCLNIL